MARRVSFRLFTAAVTLTTGTMFLMWLGEQITERGLGNGISMIILAGIIAGLPAAFGGTLELVNTGEMNPAIALILVMLMVAVTAFVVFVERGSAGSPSTTPSGQQGRRVMPASPRTCRSS
jgi:preprotein translocase subunit SecY